MENLITPVVGGDLPPPGRHSARYDWASHADGNWHQWRSGPTDENPADSQRAADRLRLAAAAWAKRRGGYSESRWTKHGRCVWIAIHLPRGDE